MARLYTINGVYPDTNFAFTLTAEALSIAPAEHLHPIEEVHGLSAAVAAKASTEHTHVARLALIVGESRVTGDVVLSPGSGASISNTGNEVTLASAPAQTGVVAGLRNANPARRHALLRFFIGDKRAVTGDAEYLTFKEN